jgi:hypothetical protein
MGVGRRLREELGDSVKIVAAEPMQGEPVQGLRSLDDGFIPPIIDLSILDRKIFVTNRDAIVWTKKLLDEEGIFAGVSTGAIASIAVRIANEMDEGNIVFIVCDDGSKYLSSGLYTTPVEELENLDTTVWLVSRRALLGAGALLLVGCGPPEEPEVDAANVWGEQLRVSQAALAAYPSISLRSAAARRVRELESQAGATGATPTGTPDSSRLEAEGRALAPRRRPSASSRPDRGLLGELDRRRRREPVRARAPARASRRSRRVPGRAAVRRRDAPARRAPRRARRDAPRHRAGRVPTRAGSCSACGAASRARARLRRGIQPLAVSPRRDDRRHESDHAARSPPSSPRSASARPLTPAAVRTAAGARRRHRTRTRSPTPSSSRRTWSRSTRARCPRSRTPRSR